MKLNADVVIVGSGVAGLFSALNLPEEQEIILITKSDLESSEDRKSTRLNSSHPSRSRMPSSA